MAGEEHEGVGGDIYAAEFVQIARETAAWLQINSYVVGNPKFIEKYSQVVKDLKVSSTDDVKEVTIDGKVKDTKAIPQRGEIVVYRNGWKQLQEAPRKWLIVSHEIINLIHERNSQVDDTGYRYSSEVIGMIFPNYIDSLAGESNAGESKTAETKQALKFCTLASRRGGGYPTSETLALMNRLGKWRLNEVLTQRMNGGFRTNHTDHTDQVELVEITEDAQVLSNFIGSNRYCAYLAGRIKTRGNEVYFALLRSFANADVSVFYLDASLGGTMNAIDVHLLPAKKAENDLLQIGGDHFRESAVFFEWAL